MPKSSMDTPALRNLKRASTSSALPNSLIRPDSVISITTRDRGKWARAALRAIRSGSAQIHERIRREIDRQGRFSKVVQGGNFLQCALHDEVCQRIHQSQLLRFLDELVGVHDAEMGMCEADQRLDALHPSRCQCDLRLIVTTTAPSLMAARSSSSGSGCLSARTTLATIKLRLGNGIQHGPDVGELERFLKRLGGAQTERTRHLLHRSQHAAIVPAHQHNGGTALALRQQTHHPRCRPCRASSGRGRSPSRPGPVPFPSATPKSARCTSCPDPAQSSRSLPRLPVHRRSPAPNAGQCSVCSLHASPVLRRPLAFGQYRRDSVAAEGSPACRGMLQTVSVVTFWGVANEICRAAWTSIWDLSPEAQSRAALQQRPARMARRPRRRQQALRVGHQQQRPRSQADVTAPRAAVRSRGSAASVTRLVTLGISRESPAPASAVEAKANHSTRARNKPANPADSIRNADSSTRLRAEAIGISAAQEARNHECDAEHGEREALACEVESREARCQKRSDDPVPDTGECTRSARHPGGPLGTTRGGHSRRRMRHGLQAASMQRISRRASEGHSRQSRRRDRSRQATLHFQALARKPAPSTSTGQTALQSCPP